MLMLANIHLLFYLQQRVLSLSLSLLSQLIIRWSLRQNGFKSHIAPSSHSSYFILLPSLFSRISYIFAFHAIFCSFLFL